MRASPVVADSRRRPAAGVQRAWNGARWVVIALSVLGGVAVVLVASGSDDTAYFTVALVAGATPGVASGLRFITGMMIDDHDPFVRRDSTDLSESQSGYVRLLLGDVGWTLLAILGAGVATAVVLAGHLQDSAAAVVFIPLIWLLGYLPGIVAGIVLSIAIGLPLQLWARRRRGGKRPDDYIYLVVAALLPVLVVGLIATFLAVRIDEDAPGRKHLGRALWVLFGGSSEWVTPLGGPWAWIARIALLAALALFLTIVVSSVRAARIRRSARPSSPPSASAEELRARRAGSERRAQRRRIDDDAH